MKRIDYIKVFAFLAFAGSVFLSTIFHYPAFTVSWFIIMILFMAALRAESSVFNILVFTALTYIPLGLISIFSSFLNKIPPSHRDLSEFAYLLIAFIAIQTTLVILWINKKK